MERRNDSVRSIGFPRFASSRARVYIIRCSRCRSFRVTQNARVYISLIYKRKKRFQKNNLKKSWKYFVVYETCHIFAVSLSLTQTKQKHVRFTNNFINIKTNYNYALFYERKQSVLANKAGNRVFYPKAVHKGSVRLPKIAREVAEYSSLTAGDVQNTIENLVRVMARHMQSSEVVYIDGLGSFRIVMRSKGKGVDSIGKVSPSQATLTVRFRPEDTRNADGKVATRSMVTGTKCILFDPATGTAVDDPASGGGSNPGGTTGGNTGAGGSGDEGGLE